ncbi:retrovirus-related pol polyprotein from transposon TNT 1-94 [Tanacetum coccineum]
MQNNLALIAKYFKKLYKPTNNNLKTSSISRNKNVDTTLSWETCRPQSGSAATGRHVFNYKEFGHFAKEYRKPKRVKDSMYHKEKMLLCKQAEKGVSLQAEQSDWLADTDDEIDEQELEAHYSFMTKIQEVPTADSGIDTEPLEQTECKSVLTETSRTLGESDSIRDSCLVALQNKQTELEEYIAFNNRTVEYEKPCLYEIPHDQSDPANRLIPNREEIMTLEEESRSKLNKDLVKSYDYTIENSLYEIFKPPTQEYQIQLAHANEIRKKMWRKYFVKKKPNISKNIDFLPVSKSIRKCRQAYNVMTNNISQLKDIVDQAWVKNSNDHINLRPPTTQDMQILIKTCLMPLALKTQNDSFAFVHELKQEMHADLKCVKSLKDEIDELESDKAEFSNMYDMLLQECVSNDLSKQTEFVSKEVYTELLQSFAKLEKHSISLELALQQCQEQMKNDTVYKEKASNVFQKEREQYFEIQDLKAQLQDKNIAISELKKLIEKCKGKSVETKFDKPSVVRQPNAQRIPKPSVLGKPAPFSDSLERNNFVKKKSVSKTNESEGLSKPVTSQNLPQTASQAVRNTNVIKPGMYRIESNTLGSSFYVPRMKKTPEGIKWTFHDDPKKSSSPVISVRTDRGTEFLNKTLNAFFKEEGIEHQTSTPRTPEQNGVVERRNRTLVEAARMMLSASKLPLFFWAEAIATACYTQNRSIIIPAHEKMAYHIINDRKPSIKHPFTSLVDLYLTFRCVYNRDMVDSLNPSISDLMRNKRVRDVCAKTLQASFPKRTKASDYENPEPRPRKSTKCFPSADT